MNQPYLTDFDIELGFRLKHGRQIDESNKAAFRKMLHRFGGDECSTFEEAYAWIIAHLCSSARSCGVSQSNEGAWRLTCVASKALIKQPQSKTNTKNMKQETKESIDRYVRDGVPTGDFLRAALSNDLMESFARADLENRYTLFEICMYIHNEIPRDCWGSYAIVDAWIARKVKERATTT